MTIRTALKEAELKLLENNKEKHPAKFMLMHYLNMESHEVINNMDQEISQDLYEVFMDGITRYLNNYPLQYIIGNEIFYGYNFKVNENVLIPRFETEELVTNILERVDEFFADYDSIDIVDIGTGSGAISITLDLEEPKFNMMATDISFDALDVAKSNNNTLGANVTFLQGDMLEPIQGKKFDIIVSNPPYIPAEQEIDSLVKDNEPHVALFGGNDGLKFYRIIIEGSKHLIKEKGMLAFEIGYDQKEAISNLVESVYPNTKYEVLKDMQGKDRMLFIYININN